jgi:hypothetical protein
MVLACRRSATSEAVDVRPFVAAIESLRADFRILMDALACLLAAGLPVPDAFVKLDAFVKSGTNRTL